MPSTYTTSLRLTLPATGENSGTWGNIVNTGITQLVDDAVAGTTNITVGGSNYTLTNTEGGTNEARRMFIVATGSPGAPRDVICPAVSKLYFFYNNVTGGHALTLKTLSGTGVSVPNGKLMVLRCDGTNVIGAVNHFDTLSLNTPLPASSGGTGAASLAAANIPATNAANTFTATQTFSGTSSTLGMVLSDAAEVCTVSATAATGTIAYDVTTQSVLFYTTNASGNWTVNLRASAGTTLNTAMSTGQSVTVVFLVTQGTTAYYNTTVQVDGTTSGVTTRWQGGAAPAAGFPSGVDAYSYTVIKTGSGTFSVFASQTRFA